MNNTVEVTEHREALEWAGRVAGGFVLVDTGGRHWSPAPGAGGWQSLEEAEAEAKARNAREKEREEERWLCSACEEAGQILPGHFACGF